MEITEVRVKLVDQARQDKLKAFCSITIDDAFVVRDLKIIEGTKGLFVAMPSRKLSVRCGKCGFKNQVRSNFCSDCGRNLPPDRGRDSRPKLHADIAHPINSECRDALQARVIEDFLAECDAAAQPGYEPPSYDDFEVDVEEVAPAREPVLAGAGSEAEASDGAETRGRRSRRGGQRSRRGSRGRRGGGASRERGANSGNGTTPVAASAKSGSEAKAGPGPRAERSDSGESTERSGRSRRRRRGRGRGGDANGEKRGTRGGRGERNGSSRRGRGRSEQEDPKLDAFRPPVDLDAKVQKQKAVESADLPPDDNFGVGIF